MENITLNLEKRLRGRPKKEKIIKEKNKYKIYDVTNNKCIGLFKTYKDICDALKINIIEFKNHIYGRSGRLSNYIKIEKIKS